MTDAICYQLIETEQKMLSYKIICFWQRDKISHAIQLKIAFIRVASKYIDQSCLLHCHQDNHRPVEIGLLNIRNWTYINKGKCCFQTIPDSVYNVTSDTFWFGEKKENTMHSIVKITLQTMWCNCMAEINTDGCMQLSAV